MHHSVSLPRCAAHQTANVEETKQASGQGRSGTSTSHTSSAPQSEQACASSQARRNPNRPENRQKHNMLPQDRQAINTSHTRHPHPSTHACPAPHPSILLPKSSHHGPVQSNRIPQTCSNKIRTSQLAAAPGKAQKPHSPCMACSGTRT